MIKLFFYGINIKHSKHCFKEYKLILSLFLTLSHVHHSLGSWTSATSAHGPHLLSICLNIFSEVLLNQPHGIWNWNVAVSYKNKRKNSIKGVGVGKINIFFKELISRSQTYELRGQGGGKKMYKSKTNLSHCPTNIISKTITHPLKNE